MKALITAFGSFPGVDINPSELLLGELKKVESDSSFCSFKLLPVDYDFCKGWLDSLEEKFDLVIHLGVASNATENRAEILAKNFCGKTADIQGKVNFGKISEHSFEKIQSNLSLRFLETKHTHPIQVSNDAGDYLCNFLFFKSLEMHAEKNVLFYHITSLDVISVECQVKHFHWFFDNLKEENFKS